MDKKQTFCYKYLTKISGIKSQTIESLIECDYDSIHALLALDLTIDLDRLPNVSMGQKSLLRKTLTKLHEKYNNIENKSDIDSTQYKTSFYKKAFSESSIRQIVEQEVFDLNSSDSQSLPSIVEKDRNESNFDEKKVKNKKRNRKKKVSFGNKSNNKLSKSKVKPNICLICGDFALKSNRFGVKSCVACNSFFARVIKYKRTLPECPNLSVGKVCEINKKTRNSCQKCRFNKCLEMGMNSDFVENKNSSLAEENGFEVSEESGINCEEKDTNPVVDSNQNESIISNERLEKTFKKPNIHLTRISTTDFSNDDKKCAICGAKSNKGNSLQFEVESCGGCGSFFRRVVANVHKLSGCVANGNCVINEKTRNSCKQCRFDKCLEKGMNRNKVLSFKAKDLKTTVKSLKRKKNANRSQDIEESAESIENSEVIESNVSLNESMQKNFAVVYCGRGFDSEIVTKRKKNY